AARRPVGDVGAAVEAYDSRREDAMLLVLLRRDEAIGGEERGPVEALDVGALGPPGAAVVAVEVVVLLEEGIIMGGQHFPVRIDVDARSPGLLEKIVEVPEIVAG